MKKNKTIKTIVLLWFGSLSGAGFAFLTQVFLARMLGVAQYGVFSSSLATVSLLCPLAAFGVAQFWLKVFGLEGVTAVRWINGSIKFTVISTLSIYFILNTWAFWGKHDELTSVLICILSFFVFGQMISELLCSKFQLEGKYNELAIWQFLPHFLRFSLILLFGWILSTKFNVYIVAFIYSVISVIVFIFGWFYLKPIISGQVELSGHKKNTTNKVSLYEEKPSAYSVFKESWPYGIAALSHIIYYQSNIVLIKYLIGNEVAATYNVAFTLIVAIYLLPNVIYQGFFLPKIHIWINHDLEKVLYFYKSGLKIMLLLGVGAMLFLVSTSSIFIPMLFTEKYSDSVPIVNILSLSVPFMFLAFNSGSLLVTNRNIIKKVKYMGVVAVINLVLNFILIKFVGVYGAAIATVITNLLLFLFFDYGVKKHILIFGR